MKIYTYSPETSEFIEEVEARLDPVEKKPIFPAYCTDEKPPETGENEISIFQNGDWIVLTDKRGQKYYSTDFEEFEIEEIGQDIPEGYRTAEQHTAALEQYYADTQWIRDRLEAYEAKGWTDAYQLIDDILERGIEVVKIDREQIKTDYPKA